MGIYFPNKAITTTGQRINVPGQIIQVVDNTATVSGVVTTGAWLNFLQTYITITNPSNVVMVEYFMNDRSDQGNGTWSLIYHRILRNGTQVMYSGYNGAAANYIGFYERTFFDSPGAGTHQYAAQCLAYQGVVWIGNYNSGSTQHYLRLYEIGV